MQKNIVIYGYSLEVIVHLLKSVLNTCIKNGAETQSEGLDPTEYSIQKRNNVDRAKRLWAIAQHTEINGTPPSFADGKTIRNTFSFVLHKLLQLIKDFLNPDEYKELSDLWLEYTHLKVPKALEDNPLVE